MKKNYPLFGALLLITVSSAIRTSDESLVKPRKQRTASTATLKEECATLMADMLELSQSCLHRLLDTCTHALLDAQKSITTTMRAWIADEQGLAGASKTALMTKRDALISLKKRYEKACDESNRLNRELLQIKAELKEFEALCY
ncbi:hypothetical protein JST99_01445 [Candidatus Dependentiae bacterium]|nr:hypothetical protein [Candidatus Dependentiae bacterium]